MKETNRTKQEAAKGTVTVYLPREGNGPFVEGAINGVNFRIPTETAVEVPLRIAKLLRQSRQELADGESAVAAYSAASGRKIG